MLAIFKRDFKSLFHSVIGFLFVGLLLAVFGLNFTVYNLQGASTLISSSLVGIVLVTVFATPLLTMRSLSEERKFKTDQLLLTSPVSVFEIVFGKFLALAAIFSIVVGIICLTPILMSFYGEVDFVQNYIAILGFWLYGLVCISVGMFVSSFFESQILAAIVSFVALFLGYMMNSFSNALNAHGILQQVLKSYDFVTPLFNFITGKFLVSDVIYDVSVIALMIFLICRVVLKRRWTVSSRKVSGNLLSFSTLALGILICIGVNILGTYIPKKYASFDLTTQKLYTFSKEASDFAKSVDSDISIYVCGKEAEIKTLEKTTLTSFDEASEKITVEYIDISANPKYFSSYSEEELDIGSLVVVYGDKYRVIEEQDLYLKDSDNIYVYNVIGYDGEGQIASAISYVTQDHFTTVYTLEGHDEVKLDTQFTNIIKKANWELKSLNLLGEKKVPSDCEVLIINAPQTDFSKDDVEKVLAYIKDGGDLILTYDCLCNNDLKNYKSLLNDYGISVKKGMVFDNDASRYYTYPNVLLPNVEYSDAAEDFNGSLKVVAPYCCAFDMPIFSEEHPVSTLLTTSYNATLDEKVTAENIQDKMEKALDKAENEESKDNGMFYTVALSFKGEKDGKVIVYGSPYIFTNQFNELVSGRNAELLLKNLQYMITEEAGSNESVVIPAKNLEQGFLTVPQSALLIFGLLLGIVAPVLLILFGIVFWAVRRRR